MKLSNEQLTKLLLHTTGVNSVLSEVLLSFSPKADADPGKREVEIDVYVIGGEREKAYEPEKPQPLNLDHLCGDWKGGKKKPDLMIFKGEPGYMAAWGKMPKKGETGSCYLIHEAGGRLCVGMGDGIVFLYYNKESDTLMLYPGGEYTRAISDKK